MVGGNLPQLFGDRAEVGSGKGEHEVARGPLRRASFIAPSTARPFDRGPTGEGCCPSGVQARNISIGIAQLLDERALSRGCAGIHRERSERKTQSPLIVRAAAPAYLVVDEPAEAPGVISARRFDRAQTAAHVERKLRIERVVHRPPVVLPARHPGVIPADVHGHDIRNPSVAVERGSDQLPIVLNPHERIRDKL